MKLHFKKQGSGFPVIILHGLLGSLDNWQTVAKYLQEQFTVYLVDQRNHGKSPHSEKMDFDLMVQDLETLMDEEGITKAHLIGHSMGGKTAMNFALQHPQRVEQLVVVDIGPRQYEPGHDMIFRALFAMDPSAITSRGDAEEQLEYYIHNQGIRLFLLKNLQREKDGSFSWKMNLEGIYSNYDNILEAVESDEPFDHPVLFIRGGKSDYIQDQDMDGIKQLFPNARLHTIEESGHWVHAEARKPFIQAVKEFLR